MRDTSDPRVFRPEGMFDEAVVDAVMREIGRVEPGGHVLVDLSRAWDVQDHELALLAHRLATCGRRATLVGVGRHHLRVLRYLGHLDLCAGDDGPLPPRNAEAAAVPG